MDSTTFLDRLHHELLGHALAYFFPESTVERGARQGPAVPELAARPEGDQAVALEWLGVRYRMRRSPFAFTHHHHPILPAIGPYPAAPPHLPPPASQEPRPLP